MNCLFAIVSIFLLWSEKVQVTSHGGGHGSSGHGPSGVGSHGSRVNQNNGVGHDGSGGTRDNGGSTGGSDRSDRELHDGTGVQVGAGDHDSSKTESNSERLGNNEKRSSNEDIKHGSGEGGHDFSKSGILRVASEIHNDGEDQGKGGSLVSSSMGGKSERGHDTNNRERLRSTGEIYSGGESRRKSEDDETRADEVHSSSGQEHAPIGHHETDQSTHGSSNRGHSDSKIAKSGSASGHLSGSRNHGSSRDRIENGPQNAKISRRVHGHDENSQSSSGGGKESRKTSRNSGTGKSKMLGSSTFIKAPTFSGWPSPDEVKTDDQKIVNNENISGRSTGEAVSDSNKLPSRNLNDNRRNNQRSQVNQTELKRRNQVDQDDTIRHESYQDKADCIRRSDSKSRLDCDQIDWNRWERDRNYRSSFAASQNDGDKEYTKQSRLIQSVPNNQQGNVPPQRRIPVKRS